MRSISAREANQGFSKLLADVLAGDEVVITKHGKPVAKLVPIAQPVTDTDREEAIREMVELLEQGWDLGGKGFTRDEMHER